MPLIPFARMSKPGLTSRGYSGERLINWFVRPSPGGVAEIVLMGRSGMVGVADFGASVRASIRVGSDIYVAAGGVLWKWNGTSTTNVGTINDGATYMATSGQEVAVVVGGVYYVCDGSTTTSYMTGEVTLPRFVTYLRGYFIVAGDAAGRGDGITWSGVDDATTFNALDFVFAEGNADALTGLVADHGEIWAFGAETIEVFYATGNADTAFAPNPSQQVEKGAIAGTVAQEDNALFYVGQDRVVYRGTDVISTREVEEALLEGDIVGGFSFGDRGHRFYAVTVAGRPTLCYDVTTGLWCEFATGADWDPWIATGAVIVDATQYFTTTTGKLCVQSGYTDDGAVLSAQAVSMPIVEQGNWMRVSRVIAHVETGTADIGRTPQIMMQTSRNGRTWSLEKWQGLANIGEYWQRAIWRGLGAFKRVQFRFVVTDPVPRDFYGVWYG